jgi:glycosyltransferase involved in cell wall biosynthesis
MKLIYLTFQEDAELYLGVTRKIKWQVHAFEELGYEVTHTLWKNECFIFFHGSETLSMPVTSGYRRMHRFSLAVLDYLGSHRFDVAYLRLDRISFDVIRICRTLKESGTRRILIEIPNYPYLGDYIRSVKGVRPFSRQTATLLKVLCNAAEDRLAGKKLRGCADAAVLIGDRADRFFGLPAINITNGVDVSEFSFVRHPEDSGEVVLVGVAGTLWWQAYDRVLEGMRIYRDRKKPEEPRVRFVLVGGDPKEMPAFLEEVGKRGLQDDVQCRGFLRGEELMRVYASADLGVSSLGCYRRGLTHCSSLKAREYCAAGLPFLYAYEDDAINGNPAFALKLPNDSSPVDIGMAVRFALRCRSDPSLGEQEKEFARQNYDWKTILGRVLAFAGA